jgi:hypothetical protein
MAVQKRGPEDDTCFPGVVEKCEVSGALHSNQSPISAATLVDRSLVTPICIWSAW